MRQLLQRGATGGNVRSARPALTVLAALGLALAPAAVAPPAAGAAPTCATTGATTTCTFSAAGAETWTVPVGVTQATFDVYGAQGGTGGAYTGQNAAGGRGAHLRATLPVASGATLQVIVGGQGQTSPNSQGGSNGGGGGPFNGGSGVIAGGGGASDVRQSPFGLEQRVLVAGGGGGGGGAGQSGGARGGEGGSSGTPGTPGTNLSPGLGGGGGAAGTATSGGPGGARGGGGDNGEPGSPGTLGRGGDSNSTGNGGGNGGGGGGGYYGGGGGGEGGVGFSDCCDLTAGGGGGGGGASFAAPGATGVALTDGARAGDGQVVITYTTVYAFSGFLAPVDNPPAVNTGRAGRAYPVKWRLADAAGAPISALSAVSSITYQGTACGAFGAAPAAPLEAEATGTTGLRYDAAAGQYVYNWQTPGAAGCYTLLLTLNNGLVQRAFFDLR